MKKRGEKIAMLTAYDYSMAKIIDRAGVDIILVGDSASNVMAGNETTLPITLDQIVDETREMPVEVVAELVDRILLARHGGVETSVATAWKAETSRRIAEIESGKVKGVPLDESLARARKIAGL